MEYKNFNNIILPNELSELKSLKQWVGYKLQPRNNGKSAKIPVNPNTGTNASSTDSNTWGTFDEAVKSVSQYKLVGIGFEFANNYTGIDLDNVVLGNGELKEFALKLLNYFNSYTEVSPSGNGLHIICKNSFTIGSRNDSLGLEIYSYSRFFTITGNVYGAIKPIEERTDQVKNIYDKYFNKKQNSTTILPNNFTVQDDSRLWEVMFNNKKNGSIIRKLFNGDISDYNNNDSSADLALCNYLAWWTNGDFNHIDRMFRQTKLMRPKWDENRGDSTYGMMTIRKSLENSFNTNNDKSIYVPDSNSSISNLVQQDDDCDLRYVENDYENDVIKHKSSFYKTGFSNIDDITGGICPSLYVIAAAPSIGKTTFTKQLADQLAKSGKSVLYFSLEQGKRELVSKSINRIMAQMNVNSISLDKAVNVYKISSFDEEQYKNALDYYKNFAANINSITIDKYDITIELIKSKIEKFIQQHNITPIVFIDYLQIISSEMNYDTKREIDENIKALKSIQSQNKLIMFLISSINRTSYSSTLDLDSLKESGSIEYTADVIWGLQFKVMSDKDYIKKSVDDKKVAIIKAKAELPRKIELICLKNREDISPYSCYFDYYSNCDYFKPTTIPDKHRETV